MIELGVPYPVPIRSYCRQFCLPLHSSWHINVSVYQTCNCSKEKAKRMITNRERTSPHIRNFSQNPPSTHHHHHLILFPSFAREPITNRQICPINQKPISSNPGENFLFTTHFLENEPSYSNYSMLPTFEAVEWPILDWCTFVLWIN